MAETERHAALVDHDRRPQAVRTVAPQRRGERFGEAEPAGVQRHADLGIAAQAVELGDLLRRGDAARDRHRGIACRRADLFGKGEIGALKAPLALDEGHEKTADQLAQLGDALEHALAGALAPAFYHHLAMTGVEGGDHALGRQRAQHLGPRRGAEHHLLCAAVEPGDRAGRVADAAADPAPGEVDQVLDDRGVRALPERRVEIDHRDLADQAEAPGERARIAGIQRLCLAADQLDRLAILQVDRGDDHGRGITLFSWRSCIPQSAQLVTIVRMIEGAHGRRVEP